MPRFGRWLWRRHRHHYVAAVSALSATVLVFGLVLPGIVLGSLFADLTVRQASVWGVWAVALSVVAATLGIWRTRDKMRPITAWADGDETDPIASWNAALSMPANLARSVAKTEWIAHFCFSVPAAAILGDLSILDAVALGIGSTMLVVVGGVGFGNGLLVLLRPCIDEIAPSVPAGERPEMVGWSLASRLNVGVASILWVLSLGAIAAVLGPRATMRDYFVGLAVTAIMTLYGVAIFNVGLVRPTVTTVRELLGAIERVQRGEFSERVPVAGIDEFGGVAAAFNDMQLAMHERESLRAAFGSYVDPTLASRLLTQDNSIFEGEDVEVTAFFADVRGFTTFADSATARESVQLLNRLFEILVPVIHDMGGHANHYLGDGLLAVFGAPNPLANHADMAVAAAIEIQRQVSREFGGELRIGIGINTGQVIAGTIGGGGRLEFTVIGDAVNVASRLERLTKETGDAILLTDSTMAALSSCSCRTVNRGEVEVRGKAKRLRVHAIQNEDLLAMHGIDPTD